MTFYRKSEIPEHLLEHFEPAEIGLETTPDEYVAELVAVFAAVRRVLRDDGTLWLNLGDSYIGGGRGGGGSFADERPGWADTPPLTGESRSIARSIGLKPKDLVGIPWRVAFALQADGWWLRSDIIWAKPNPMPESMTDRPTKAHEYIFLLAKSERYFYDADAIKEPFTDYVESRVRREAARGMVNPVADNRIRADAWITTHQQGARLHLLEAGRNKRSVWTVPTKPYNGAHFATFPPQLIEPCIKAACPEGGTVLDPFLGSGTTAEVAQRNGCKCVGVELNPDYVEIAKARFRQRSLLAASG